MDRKQTPLNTASARVNRNPTTSALRSRFSRTSSHQPFEYTFEAPAAGKYRLSARVATPSWKQGLKLVVNGKGQPLDVYFANVLFILHQPMIRI